MILQPDVASGRLSVFRPRLELAVGDPLQPVVAVEFVFHGTGAVQPMLHVVAVYENARGVPLTDGPRQAAGNRMEPEVGPRRGEGRPTVGVVVVVEDLHFGSPHVDALGAFHSTEKDATVPAELHLPFQC